MFEYLAGLAMTVATGAIGAFVKLNGKQASLSARVERSEEDIQSILKHTLDHTKQLTSLEVQQDQTKEILEVIAEDVKHIRNGS